MPAPPLFQRAPRIYPDLPNEKFEIAGPPPAPAAASTTLLSVLLPAAGTLVGLGAVAAFAIASGGNGALLSFAISMPLMLTTYLVAILNYTTQRRTQRRQTEERLQKYRLFLQGQHQALSQLRAQQQGVLWQTDPDPEECLHRGEQRDRQLWSRAPHDADFLVARLGVGNLLSQVPVQAPKQPSVLEADPLVDEAQALATEFTQLPQVPVCLPLGTAGVVGLAGARQAVLNTARTLALQLATHHSPDEVKIVALYAAHEEQEWGWLRWLPHIWTDDGQARLLACGKADAHSLSRYLYDLLARRRASGRAASQAAPPILPVLVVFLTDPELVEGTPLQHLLVTQGPQWGAFAVFLADRPADLPQQCRAIVEVGPVCVLQPAPGAAELPFAPDLVSPELADRFARTLAPIRLQRMAAPTEIPALVPLLTILKGDTVEALDIAQRWQAGIPFRSLAVPIGYRAGGEVVELDLHERGHGPHGLVAGATGSGKSELLQTLITALAVQFDPREVVFVIVDYKGGGMANVFRDIPHLVGTITNLDGNLALRALTALKSELQRRQTLLAHAGVVNLDDYQRQYRQGKVGEPLPHLVFLVDEFAELKAAQPDFIKELISTVRIGRSLGVHLILATQKPAGVVDEQIWSNARFRLCLRVERPEDSKEVLKRPDAADLTVPGRAYLQVGNDEMFELFQTAWGGTPYTPGGVVTGGGPEIATVDLAGRRQPLGSAALAVTSAAGNQLAAVIAQICDVAQRERIGRLPGPWLAPLPEQVILEQVRPDEGWDGRSWRPVATWLEPVIGLVDDPAQQRQGPLRLPLGQAGHLGVYGQPGSGKTTLVQTLITALALTYAPQDVHFYLLDFGGRLLTQFAPLPHVGAVILPDDAERLGRLLRFLQQELDERKARFARAGVSTLPAYRNATRDRLPALVVVVDNYPALTNTYPDLEDGLLTLAREGGGLGIHLVLTATGAIRGRIGGNLTLAVTLSLADRGEYSMIVGRTGGLEPAPLPGRGLIKSQPPLEFQTALPIAGADEAQRSLALRARIQELALASQGGGARPVPALPAIVPLADVLSRTAPGGPQTAQARFEVPLGLEVDDLEPLLVDLFDGPHFLITGPAQSGKTVLLQSWLLALAVRFRPERLHLYLIDFRSAGLLPLAPLPHVRAYITDDDQCAMALAEIADALAERRKAIDAARQAAGGTLDVRTLLSGYPAVVVAVDDWDAAREIMQMATKDRLEKLVRRERDLGFHLLLAGTTNDINASFDGPVKALKDAQIGFLLASSEHNDLQIFNLRLPMGEAGKPLPPGQGFYARRGRFRKIKVATAHAGPLPLRDWVMRLAHRQPVPTPPG